MKRFRTALAAALLLVSGAVSAHRFHAGIADVSFNARTGSTEIVHTYMAHDIEALLTNLYGRQFDLTDPEDQEVLRKYVEPRFWLQGQDKSRLKTRWVGVTIDPTNVTLYQEVEQTPVSKVGAVHNTVLVDFLPDQVNTVNLNDGNAVRTLTFNLSTPEQPVR